MENEFSDNDFNEEYSNEILGFTYHKINKTK